mmetsp:Transcript_86127/g.219483  ORF Transcript_86127/g.219483 Transcript_86127/m.219483 type:complete len:201 (+) Transcript_86127:714-1316(+)
MHRGRVPKSLPIARRRLPCGGGSSNGGGGITDALDDDLALALQLHAADVAESRVLQQFVQPRVAERGLAELEVETGAEQPLDVGKGNDPRLAVHGGVLEDLPQASAGLLPSGQRHVRCSLLREGHRLLPDSTLLLDPIDGTAKRDHVPLQVTQNPLLRDRELHDVANLAQGAVLQERQAARKQHLRAGVAAAGQQHILAL